MRFIIEVIAKASYDENGQHAQPIRYTHRDGCYSLLWEVLTDVFRVASLCTEAARIQAALDAEWIRSDEVSLFSFLWVCQHLSIDPATVRRAYFSGQAQGARCRSVL